MDDIQAGWKGQPHAELAPGLYKMYLMLGRPLADLQSFSMKAFWTACVLCQEPAEPMTTPKTLVGHWQETPSCLTRKLQKQTCH